MEVDYQKQEINLRRLLSAVERLASTSSRELALEATATSAFVQSSHLQNEQYKSPYVISLFKKYIEDISRTLDSMNAAREEWDLSEDRQRESNATNHGILPSVASSSAASASDTNSSISRKRISSKEPPSHENLEEYRRKLSFLANLLNAPRWNLPQNQAATSRVVRNQRIPYQVQLAELETLAKVQVQVRDNLRAQLTLPRLASDNSTSVGPSNYAELSSAEGDWSSSASSPRLSSPTQKMLNGSHSPLSSPSASDDPLEDLFQGSIDSDAYDTGASDAESESTQGTVVRQLWKTGSTTSANTSYGSDLGRKLGRNDDSELGDINRLLQADTKIQDELTDELVRYTSAMKESALHAGLKIRSDASQLDKMSDKLEANTHATQNASATVTELLNTTSTSFWAYWSMMSTVVIVFIVLYVFMKIVPKP